MKMMKSKLIIPLLLSAIALSSCSDSKETERFMGYIKDENYIKAANYYTKNRSSIEVKNLSELLIDEADSIYNSYLENKLSLSAVSSNLNSLISIADGKAEEAIKEKIELIPKLEESQEQYNLGIEAFEAGNYSEAAACFEKVIEQSPLYNDAQEKISTANQKYEALNNEIQSEATRKIDEYIKSEKYYDAKNTLDDYSSECSDKKLVESLTNSVEKTLLENIQKNMDSFFNDFDYESAYNYVKKISDAFEFESVDNKLNSLESDYAEFVLVKAKSSADSENYEAASSMIEKAMAEIGDDNSNLNAAYNEYCKHLSVYLTDMSYMSVDGHICVNEQLHDNTDNVHRNSMYIYGDFDSSSAEYFINGNYSVLKGICGCSYDQRGSHESMYFEIYGDGNLLYTSPTITSSFIPENFEIDIGGVTVLKIWYAKPNSYGWRDCPIATIYDAMLIPKNE